MMKRHLTILSLLLIGACHAKPGEKVAAAGLNASTQKAVPVIAVNGSQITINGTTVWLGDTLDAWKRVLGGAPACYDAGLIVSCVWHSNGLTLGTSQSDKTRVKFMNLHIAMDPPELGERAPSWPKAPFHGTLELDGIPIQVQTTFRDLRRQVAPGRDLRCGGRDCGNPSGTFSDAANIYMNLAGRSENSRIMHFSVSCSSTESCTALIPQGGKR